MYIVGISAYYHDSAAALLHEGKIVAAAQEERFTRKKADSRFPISALRYCLETARISPDEIDALVYYEKPFLTFDRILETALYTAPGGWRSFMMSMPLWLKEKLFFKSMLRKEVRKHFGAKLASRIYFSEHHLSHAASAFYPSPFQDAAILCLDAVGEWATASIAHGKGSEIQFLRQMNFPHSWGLFYSAVTQYLGFKVNSGEYKLMGLAPYGDPHAAQTLECEKKIREHLLTLHKDGSLTLNLKYFTFLTGDRMINKKKWQQLFGIPPRDDESLLSKEQANLAFAAQKVLEDGLVLFAKTAKELTGSSNLVMAGGVALNCVATEKIKSAGLFKEVWVQPAAHDAGGALGAALAFHHLHAKAVRHTDSADVMQGSYLGPEFSSMQIQATLEHAQIPAQFFSSEKDLFNTTVDRLTQNNVVGWFQGRMEWGPRALGNRSIIASAQDPEMQKKLNLRIKFRETFRPFAPIVMYEHAQEYFEGVNYPLPYMLQTAPIAKKWRENLPTDFRSKDITSQLRTPRSTLPSITHVDFSARLQTVHKETNPRCWSLLKHYHQRTGCPVLINTSFNVRGEPIVCTPEEALRCFIMTDMDVLVLGDYMVEKSKIAHLGELRERFKQQTQFALD